MFQHLNLFSSLGWKVASWWPGVVLAILGSVLNNIGTNVMKLAINKRQQLPPEERPRLTRFPLWTSGFAMFTLGTAMSFGAFKFAAQSLLSGLASVQFLSQVVFSRFVLHEKIEKYAYVGVSLIICGCVSIVIFGAHGTKNYRPEELAALYGRSEYVCYMLGAGFLACVVSLTYTAMKQRIMRDRNLGRFDIAHATVRERQILAVFFSVKSALFGTQAVVLAKSLSMLLIQALHPNPAYSNPLLSYQTYFILLGFISAATYWVTRLNHGLRLFEAVYLVPMMQICWILFSTIAGGIYYEEFIEFGRKEYGAYAVGFLCVLVGVALLCPRDDVKSLNAADVIYEIVSDENPLLSPSSPGNNNNNGNSDDESSKTIGSTHKKFKAFDDSDVNNDGDDDEYNGQKMVDAERGELNHIDQTERKLRFNENDNNQYNNHDDDHSTQRQHQHQSSHDRTYNRVPIHDRESNDSVTTHHHHHPDHRLYSNVNGTVGAPNSPPPLPPNQNLSPRSSAYAVPSNHVPDLDESADIASRDFVTVSVAQRH